MYIFPDTYSLVFCFRSSTTGHRLIQLNQKILSTIFYNSPYSHSQYCCQIKSIVHLEQRLLPLHILAPASPPAPPNRGESLGGAGSLPRRFPLFFSAPAFCFPPECGGFSRSAWKKRRAPSR